jgi:hypothetical protein
MLILKFTGIYFILKRINVPVIEEGEAVNKTGNLFILPFLIKSLYAKINLPVGRLIQNV